MFEIFMTAKQAGLIEKSDILYNRIQYGDLESLVDSFLSVCTNSQKKYADVASAKDILSELSTSLILSPHPFENNLEILPVPCSDQYTFMCKAKNDLVEYFSRF